MKYRLIGVDLDGTLLDRAGRLSPRNAAAIAAAQAAGVTVVPCTGRAWRESLLSLRTFPNPAKGIFAGGAAVVDIPTGDSVDVAIIEPHLAMRLVDHITQWPVAGLVLTDANITGHDYLVTGRGSLSASTEWWFQTFGATAKFTEKATPEDLHHALRVSLVGPPDDLHPIAQSVESTFGQEVTLHSFEALRTGEDGSVYLLEIFARDVNKWRGLAYLANAMGLEPGQVAIIGDEINDLAAFQGAGCGIAMGNAIDTIKHLARHITHDCDNHGVAHALEQLLAGNWD